MKQHITVKQLNELNLNQLENLKKFSYKSDNVINGGELLSIGQMIEFLGVNNINCCLVDKIDESPGKPHWSVQLFNKDYGLLYLELVDALWELVKEVLNVNN